MDRRAYERMEQEVRAIHRALTGEDPRLDGAEGLDDGATEPADTPAAAEHEVERRFTALALEARSVPSIAAKLSAFEFAAVVEQGEGAVGIGASAHAEK